MDRLAQKLPIRSKQLKAPVVFIANIPTSVYKAFGTVYYDNLFKLIKNQPNTSSVHLLANIVGNSQTIEERADNISKKVSDIYN